MSGSSHQFKWNGPFLYIPKKQEGYVFQVGILFRYLKNYKKEGVLAPLFKMLEATFELFIPLVVAVIVDKGIGEGDRGTVIGMSLLLLGLGIVGLACSVTAQYFSARAATGAWHPLSIFAVNAVFRVNWHTKPRKN